MGSPAWFPQCNLISPQMLHQPYPTHCPCGLCLDLCHLDIWQAKNLTSCQSLIPNLLQLWQLYQTHNTHSSYHHTSFLLLTNTKCVTLGFELALPNSHSTWSLHSSIPLPHSCRSPQLHMPSTSVQDQYQVGCGDLWIQLRLRLLPLLYTGTATGPRV